MTTISSFINRLKKIGIEVELSGNYPWVYLDKVNGHSVLERFQGNHGFTIFFLPAKAGQKESITDIRVVFKKIREMLTEKGRDKDFKNFIEFKKNYQS